MDPEQTEKTLMPLWTWVVRKGLTYGIPALATALGIKEGYDMAWVVPAAATLGTILSVLSRKLLERFAAKKAAQ